VASNVKYVTDRTGRFARRPHYETRELDEECEREIRNFMRDCCGGFALPIPTDALTKLIERDAEDLDLFANLDTEGSDVEGVTDFFPGQRPHVRIRASLSERSSENRLRTTLSHEWGHVHFHDCLWQVEARSGTMYDQLGIQPCPKCKRDRIVNAPESDWMEWQAGYVCGSVLMPLSQVRAVVAGFSEERELYTPLVDYSPPAVALIARMKRTFLVSEAAARMRLTKLGFLSSSDHGPTLF